MKKSKLLFMLLFGSLSVYSQDNTARLTTVIGSHIEFNFTSFDDYYNGKTITNGTTIGISIASIAPAVLTGWHIDVQSFVSQPNLTSSNGNTLPLNTIQIEATDANGNLASANFTGLQDLAVSPGNTLMSTTDPAHLPANSNTHQINLTYECGIVNGNLLGQTADQYTVEIEVILIPDF